MISKCLPPLYQHHWIQINRNNVLLVGGSGSSQSYVLSMDKLVFARKADIKKSSYFDNSAAPVCDGKYVYNIHIYSIKDQSWEMIPLII